METPFYRSHTQMRMAVYSALHGSDAIGFPLDGGVGALLDISRLNRRFANKELVEERIQKMGEVYRQHPNAFQPFLLFSRGGKPFLYGMDKAGRWVPVQGRLSEIMKAADEGERL